MRALPPCSWCPPIPRRNSRCASTSPCPSRAHTSPPAASATRSSWSRPPAAPSSPSPRRTTTPTTPRGRRRSPSRKRQIRSTRSASLPPPPWPSLPSGRQSPSPPTRPRKATWGVLPGAVHAAHVPLARRGHQRQHLRGRSSQRRCIEPAEPGGRRRPGHQDGDHSPRRHPAVRGSHRQQEWHQPADPERSGGKRIRPGQSGHCGDGFEIGPKRDFSREKFWPTSQAACVRMAATSIASPMYENYQPGSRGW